jgi:hypothetical protein
MQRVAIWASAPVLILVAALASGCVVHVGDGYTSRDYRHAERRARERIAALPLGTPLELVRQDMGEPYFTDAFPRSAGEYRILRYRTHRVRADGMTTPDETTPLVFLNNRLHGIGETALVEALNER